MGHKQASLPVTAKDPAPEVFYFFSSKLFQWKKVLTVSEEDMSCSVLGVLRVPEVLNQSFNRLKKGAEPDCDIQRAVEVELDRLCGGCKTKSSDVGVEPRHLI